MPLPLDRMTLTGLGIAALGWAALVADVALGTAPAAGTAGVTAVARSDVLTLAQATVVSGFALALLGTLRTGFGALHTFFDTVLARAGAGRAPPPPRVEPTPEPIEPVIEVEPPPRRPARGRNYSILPNGAVEVDTLLGTRVFASLDEAKDYIR